MRSTLGGRRVRPAGGSATRHRSGRRAGPPGTSEDARWAVWWSSGSAVRRRAWPRPRWRRRDAGLRVAHAFIWPAMHVPLGPSSWGPPEGGLRNMAGRPVAEAVERAKAVAPGVEVTGSVVTGEPLTVLEAQSRAAEPVAVGSRSMGGFVGLLLGSVSQAVLHHAHCPVAVVRGEDGRHGPRWRAAGRAGWPRAWPGGPLAAAGPRAPGWRPRADVNGHPVNGHLLVGGRSERSGDRGGRRLGVQPCGGGGRGP
ncbi:universal stress protein [Streptomyces caeni]|uniref:Universal stress protein n=1 Tax=Streptomyces caeni TaxID=2307231 RepID=A0ABW4IUS2_9ACTN